MQGCHLDLWGHSPSVKGIASEALAISRFSWVCFPGLDSRAVEQIYSGIAEGVQPGTTVVEYLEDHGT